MRYEKIGDSTHIFVEAHEQEQQVLRAIARASFELAHPEGLGHLEFRRDDVMTDKMLDEHIDCGGLRGTDTVLHMDYVQGRRCKVVLYRAPEGHFVLNDGYYTRHRGIPDSMLKCAQKMLVTF